MKGNRNNFEIKQVYVLCNPTLEGSIDLIKRRILERTQNEEYNNTWDNGYTQSLMDIYNILTGMAKEIE